MPLHHEVLVNTDEMIVGRAKVYKRVKLAKIGKYDDFKLIKINRNFIHGGVKSV